MGYVDNYEYKGLFGSIIHKMYENTACDIFCDIDCIVRFKDEYICEATAYVNGDRKIVKLKLSVDVQDD